MDEGLLGLTCVSIPLSLASYIQRTGEGSPGLLLPDLASAPPPFPPRSGIDSQIMLQGDRGWLEVRSV